MIEERKLIYRAGIVPYYLDENSKQLRMMFMKPSATEYGGDWFQLAKGRVDDEDVDHKSAALREGAEELGLFRGNTVFTEEVGVFMGRTTLFVSKIKDVDMFGMPDSETDSTRWMTLSEFIQDGRPLHKPVVQACYRKICDIEGIVPDSLSTIDVDNRD